MITIRPTDLVPGQPTAPLLRDGSTAASTGKSNSSAAAHSPRGTSLPSMDLQREKGKHSCGSTSSTTLPDQSRHPEIVLAPNNAHIYHMKDLDSPPGPLVSAEADHRGSEMRQAVDKAAIHA